MSVPTLYGVYLAAFPFLDTSTNKIRPVIVVGKPQGIHNITAVVPVSSKNQQVSVDVTLQDWQQAGLINPSVARVHRISTMLQADLVSQLGELSSSDKIAITTAIKKLLSLK